MSDSPKRRLAKELEAMEGKLYEQAQVLGDAARVLFILADREEKGYSSELEFKGLMSRVGEALGPEKARKRK